MQEFQIHIEIQAQLYDIINQIDELAVYSYMDIYGIDKEAQRIADIHQSVQEAYLNVHWFWGADAAVELRMALVSLDEYPTIRTIVSSAIHKVKFTQSRLRRKWKRQGRSLT